MDWSRACSGMDELVCLQGQEWDLLKPAVGPASPELSIGLHGPVPTPFASLNLIN